MEDNNLIKEVLIKYGVVAVNHNANFNESRYYNPVTNALYYNGKDTSNHAVAVVGWDDNYPAGNFNPLNRPEGDGAWIVKNSWGTNWGDGGYFYVSYYDKSFADTTSVAYIINNDSYARIYQLDIGGGIESNKNGKYYYNEFTSDADELIAAVGTLIDKAGMNYTFEIEVNGVAVYAQDGVSSFGGYETIKMERYVQIKKGDTFRVIFKNKVPVILFSRINLEPNKSKVSVDGKTWIDLYDDEEVAILKAYTIADVNITDNLVKYCGDDAAFTAQVGAGERVIFEFEGEFYNVTADEKGTCKLPIDKYDGKYNVTTTYNNISIVNYIVINSTIISSNVTRGYNSNYDYKAQVLSPIGTPLNNIKVAVSINGKFSNYTTDSSGFITIKFTKLTKDQIIIVTNP